MVSLLLPTFMVMHVMNSRQHQAVKREQELLFGVAWHLSSRICARLMIPLATWSTIKGPWNVCGPKSY